MMMTKKKMGLSTSSMDTFRLRPHSYSFPFPFPLSFSFTSMLLCCCYVLLVWPTVCGPRAVVHAAPIPPRTSSHPTLYSPDVVTPDQRVLTRLPHRLIPTDAATSATARTTSTSSSSPTITAPSSGTDYVIGRRLLGGINSPALLHAAARLWWNVRQCAPGGCCGQPGCPPVTTAPPPATGNNNEGSQDVHRRGTAVWVIVLIPILGVLIILLILCLLCFFIFRKQRRGRSAPTTTTVGGGGAVRRRSHSHSRRSSHHRHKYYSSLSAVSKSFGGVRKKSSSCAPRSGTVVRCPNCGRKLRIPISGDSGTWRHCDKGCTPQCGGCRHCPTGRRCRCKHPTKVDVYVHR